MEPADLLGRGLLDAQDDVGLGVHGRLGHDPRAGRAEVRVGDGGADPGAGLDEDLVTGSGQLADGLGHEGDAPLVGRALS